jgi:hypothetical protein
MSYDTLVRIADGLGIPRGRGAVHFHAIIRLDGTDPTNPDAILPVPDASASTT